MAAGAATGAAAGAMGEAAVGEVEESRTVEFPASVATLGAASFGELEFIDAGIGGVEEESDGLEATAAAGTAALEARRSSRNTASCSSAASSTLRRCAMNRARTSGDSSMSAAAFGEAG